MGQILEVRPWFDNVEYQENGVELQAVGPLFRETVAFIPYMNLDGIEVVSE